MPSADTGDLLAEIGEALPHIVFVAQERTGALDHLSARFGELTGAHVRDGLGLGYRAFVHPEDLVSIERAMRSAIRSRASLRSEARLRDRGGIFRWHEVRATRMRGRSAGRWLGTCTDVDDTHRAARAQAALVDVGLALASARLPDEVLTTFARTERQAPPRSTERVARRARARCHLRARSRHPGLRSIALSAYAQREDSERAIAAGFLEHLAKPVDPSHLIDTVRAIARAS